MTGLGTWSLRRVLLISGLWVGLNCLFFVWQLCRALRSAESNLESAGIAGLTVEYGLFLLIALAPPMVFVVVWYVTRRSGTLGVR